MSIHDENDSIKFDFQQNEAKEEIELPHINNR